ncbi:MAG: hypothetical protein Q8R04_01975, partial [Nanoarchaeota archaeon]|nr:hypothetical protein [Nanoarchaeota archaeon]
MKKVIAIGLILLLLIMTACSSAMGGNINQMPKVDIKNEEQANKGSLESKFALLSAAKTNFCAGPSFISQKSDDEMLQGSCCSKMDFHRYSEQVEGLKKYSNIKQIPSDPYDISVPLAKKLLNYKDTIQLNPEQQTIYDEAMKLSDEKGPCCCVCWRWHAFEGLAKYLITEH